MNSDYLRLKNINFSYTLPKFWTNRLGIANAKIYYTGENLLTFDSLPLMQIRKLHQEIWICIQLVEVILLVLI